MRSVWKNCPNVTVVTTVFYSQKAGISNKRVPEQKSKKISLAWTKIWTRQLTKYHFSFRMIPGGFHFRSEPSPNLADNLKQFLTKNRLNRILNLIDVNSDFKPEHYLSQNQLIMTQTLENEMKTNRSYRIRRLFE